MSLGQSGSCGRRRGVDQERGVVLTKGWGSCPLGKFSYGGKCLGPIILIRYKLLKTFKIKGKKTPRH